MEGLVKAYTGKRVLVTGHTGFKGSWLCEWLLQVGAEVYGFALPPPTKPSLFEQLKLKKRIKSHVIGDIRDLAAVKRCVRRVQPDFVFHLAAQPLVRYSYAHPVETFETNVMGTINILESARQLKRRCSLVCITTDKCYENRETPHPYREDDPMGGFDPYSCSKGCDELVISSYRRSFFNSPDSPVWVASARAGNVIGGGDWATDRIVPDAMRAWLSCGVKSRAKDEERGMLAVRNSKSTRPWQHVLEPLYGYLTLGAALAARRNFDKVASGFNFGPNPNANRTVGEVVEELLKHIGGDWVDRSDPHAVHEAGLLNLDIAKARRFLGWRPTWNFKKTIEKVAEWYVGVARGEDPIALTRRQIGEFSK